MRFLTIFLLFSTLATPLTFAAESVKPTPGPTRVLKPQAVDQVASQKQIANKMRALGFKVIDVKNTGGSKWQVQVAGWDPRQAQASHRNVLKWDPSIRNPSDKNTSARWDPFDKQSAKTSSVNWDPTQSNPASVDVEYSAGNIVLSKGSLKSLGIVQGAKGLPQGMQMR